jgi:hypothetical protein
MEDKLESLKTSLKRITATDKVEEDQHDKDKENQKKAQYSFLVLFSAPLWEPLKGIPHYSVSTAKEITDLKACIM